MTLDLTVKVRYGGTYQPTVSEAQAIRREALVKLGMPFELAFNCETQEKAIGRFIRRGIYNLLSIMIG